MNFLERAWYSKAPWLYLLWPLAVCFQLFSAWRRRWQKPLRVGGDSRPPVIVVGNISVGGTGKTPLIMTLVEHLQTRGKRPGVISRGYGGQAGGYPLAVAADTATSLAGDEPVLIAARCQCPVVVDPDRPRALHYLLDNYDVDVVLSDDGLQHYRLPRDLEIAVVDGARLFGNSLCLPAGPLREPVSRLQQVDAVVINGEPATTVPAPALASAFTMTLTPVSLTSLSGNEQRPFRGAPFKMGDTIQAVAALGNPQRFFKLLEQLPYPVKCFAFPDHQALGKSELEAAGVDMQQPIVMTEKDGIKCPEPAANWWTLQVAVELPDDFFALIDRRMDELTVNTHSSSA